MANARSRLLASAAASVLALAMLAGCGGSDVSSAEGPGDAQVETGADTGADTGGVTAPDGSVPQAPGTDTATAAPGATTAPGGGVAPGAGSGGTKPGKPGAPAKPGGGSSGATGGTAVETLIATHPIFGGTAACKPATLSEIAVGNVSTLSGVLGENFSPVRPALETYVAAQNACGGLNGHRIKLYVEDDQGDPSTASTKVQGLIQKKIIAFLGNIQVLTIDAVAPVINRSGVPIIGGDLTNNTWFTNPLIFPQGSPPQAISYGYLQAAKDHFKVKKVSDIWCIEVPRACEQIDRAFKELGPEMGMEVAKTVQVSITAPSYVQQCLDLKNQGVEAVALTIDAASQNRIARSCSQVGWNPKVMPYPLGVGNEKQFLQGNKWLGNSYIPMNHFPWFANNTPAEKFFQASVKKYNPGFVSGGAAALGWTAGALLTAAAAELPAQNPTSADLLKVLYSFKGQKFTQLGGLSGPLTFRQGSSPKVPYCLYGGIANAEATGWAQAISKPTCSSVVAPSDPQRNS